LATSVDPEQAAGDYERRMFIDQTFKHLKIVLKWETYTAKIPAKRRLEKLIVLSCLSYGFQLCIGTQVSVPPSEEKKTSLLQRFRHIYTSAYRKTKQLYSSMVLNCPTPNQYALLPLIDRTTADFFWSVNC